MTKITTPKRMSGMAREPKVAADAIAVSPQEGAPRNAPAIKRETKASLVRQLPTKADGATLESLCAATSWQAHTCRAFLTGLRKKGKVIERSKNDDGVSIYRLKAEEEKVGDAVIQAVGLGAEG